MQDNKDSYGDPGEDTPLPNLGNLSYQELVNLSGADINGVPAGMTQAHGACHHLVDFVQNVAKDSNTESAVDALEQIFRAAIRQEARAMNPETTEKDIDDLASGLFITINKLDHDTANGIGQDAVNAYRPNEDAVGQGLEALIKAILTAPRDKVPEGAEAESGS